MKNNRKKFLLWILALWLGSSCTVFAWENTYDARYQDASAKWDQPYAIAIIAFNRPQYLKQLLDSLEKNPESQELPFFFFLDGGPHGKQEENIQLIRNAKIKNKEIIVRDINYGCPKNHIDAKRFMFDWCGFKKVIFAEEDVVVSRNYIKNLLSLHAWAKKTYANVGVVQMWSHCFLERDEKAQILNLVRETKEFYSLVTYCMDKQLWDAISSFLYEYESLFIDPLLGIEECSRSRSKPDIGIFRRKMKMWLFKKISEIDRKEQMSQWGDQLPFLESQFDLPLYSRKHGLCVNQDWMTTQAIWLAGATRLETIVNRVINIGREGITVTEKIWEAIQYGKMVLDEFDEDDTLEEFEFCFEKYE
jgi:hypothetical protein